MNVIMTWYVLMHVPHLTRRHSRATATCFSSARTNMHFLQGSMFIMTFHHTLPSDLGSQSPARKVRLPPIFNLELQTERCHFESPQLNRNRRLALASDGQFLFVVLQYICSVHLFHR